MTVTICALESGDDVQRVAALGLAHLRSCFRGEGGVVGGVQPGQPIEHVAEVLEGIDVPAPAVFNNGAEDSRALSGLDDTEEQPVLL